MAASVLQSASNATTATIVTATLASVPTVGNTLVLIANSDSTLTLDTTSGSTGTGWTQRFSYVSDQGFYIWTRPVVSSDATVYGVVPGGGATYASLGIIELAGVTSTPFDVVGTVASGTNATSLAASTITTTAANDLVLVAHAQHGYSGTISNTFSWNNSFTSLLQALVATGASGAKTSLVVGQKVQATAGAVGATTASWSGQAQNVAAVQIAFKASAGGTNYTATPSDSVGVTDSVTAGFGPQVTPSDPVGVTDVAATARAIVVTVSDIVGVTDTGAPITLAYDYTLNDPVGVTDAASDVEAVVQAPADGVGATDAVAGSVDVLRSSADPVSVSDSVVANITGGGDYTGTPSDSVGLTDAVLAQLDRVVTVADLLNLTDAAQTSAGPTANPADPVGATDSAAWSVATSRLASDPVGVTDTLTVTVARTVTFADPVGAVDAVTAQMNLVLRDITVYVSGPTRNPLRDAYAQPNPLRVSGGTR
ncbi:hypothetical protein IT072_02295 [Leifsonia sp. ZF2019]|uniref:hypothetical protein n=1 Tax=Leifsonia sp. ZF2019 TaxID=2781978 RepID=UPI001CC0A7E9|nr:hypothetical protein [Leifsonia sp. ZF2019]UAJ78297.1 hypothetical protein IT072_13620 [Leifsonia sp. ZF2019]UAJ79927.1 hypothetical protein IT072_02295 [Leifsonia sp. ZF2019]